MTSTERASRTRARSLIVATLLTGLVFILAACGSDSADESSESQGGGGASAQETTSPSPASAPPIVIGSKNFTESLITGELYSQAFAAQGYKVRHKPNIGSTELIDRVLRDGQIDAYPEYSGVVTGVLAKDTTVYQSVEDIAAAGQKFQSSRGFTYMTPLTAFETNLTFIVHKDFADEHGLSTIADLKKLPSQKVVLYPPDATREQGYPGLKREYGIGNIKPVPLDHGLTYTALDKGEVNIAGAFSTDPQLLSGKYTALAEPKKILGIQHVGLVIKSSVLDELGPAFKQTYDKLQPLLTVEAMQQMNKATVIDKQEPKEVARTFLAANGML